MHRMGLARFGLAVIAGLASAGSAWGQVPAAAPAINEADTAWVLVSSAFVLAMTLPGLALFYGGLVRSKNVLGTIMQTFVVVCLVSLLWMAVGYSLAFGPDTEGLVGNLDWIGLSGVGLAPHAAYGPTIPHQAFMVFQMMFAAITPALITGAFAERMRFSALVLFAGLWSLAIYCPIAHWLWGGGWLARLGALDFAGGAVVHLSSGVSALVCALVLGARQGYGTDYLAPHNLPMVLLATGLLWFGWFGFNAGSALGANETAVIAFTATHIGAAAGALAWLAVEWAHRGTPTVLGIASGAVAGLAMVTPGAGYVGPVSALLIGGVAGALSYWAIMKKGKLGYDDALDVVGIHGVAGVFGMVMTGLLASKGVNASGADGLWSGNLHFFGVQILAVVAVSFFSAAGTLVILKLVDRVVGLRVTAEEERMGLDLSQHNERAYS
ncbi:ammonia/ammonium transporter [Nitrospira tepida]|uniref:Ammonium transporter n=1 Tax=Nitrospira tepida TaxID=2973512 RepID=A0AA86MY92_9BACT|nr:ammonium transporter [Nitrospira tepida]CAI4031288.1 ammonia/ammonium transporter [Nitrospira tepida]